MQYLYYVKDQNEENTILGGGFKQLSISLICF